MLGSVLLVLLLPAAPDAGATLAEARAQAMAAVVPDPEPAEITNGVHYLVSNERWPDLFEESIRGVGGALIGVGAEQNYLLAGWARPELLVLFDFDQAVVDLHGVYQRLFLASDDPQSFIARWQRSAEAKTAVLLEAPRIIRSYKRARRAVAGRLEQLLARARESGIPTFLDDPDQYGFVRGLWRDGRVFAVRGDLTREGAFLAVAAALRELGTAVRVVYLSNAEHYFSYGPAYKKNLLGLPFDDRTAVLRTHWVGRQNYDFVVQSGLDFQAWLAQDWVHDVRRLFERLEPVRGKLQRCGPPPAGLDVLR
jgi:hypothetical protein